MGARAISAPSAASEARGDDSFACVCMCVGVVLALVCVAVGMGGGDRREGGRGEVAARSCL